MLVTLMLGKVGGAACAKEAQNRKKNNSRCFMNNFESI